MTDPREAVRPFAFQPRVAYGGSSSATGAQSSTSLFSPQTYVLALDGTNTRYAASTYVLSTLAWYVYGSPVVQAARTLWERLGWSERDQRSRPVMRRDIGDIKGEAESDAHTFRVPLIVRAVGSGAGYYLVRGIAATSSSFPGYDTELFAACCQDHLVIAFRGTETQGPLTDLYNDFDGDTDPVPFLTTSGSLLPSDFNSSVPRAHQGFLDQYNAVSTDIERLLTDSLAGVWGRSDTPRVYITGHSLGGALASLCAMHLRAWSLATGRDLAISCTSFAQPRIATRGLADWVSHPTTRERLQIFAIRNFYDVVPMVPTSGPYPLLGPLDLSWTGYIPDFFNTLSTDNAYQHVGVRSTFNNPVFPSYIHRAHEEWTEWRTDSEYASEILFNAPAALPNHSMALYMFYASEELAGACGRLAGPSLNDRRWYRGGRGRPSAAALGTPARIAQIHPNEWNRFLDLFTDNAGAHGAH